MSDAERFLTKTQRVGECLIWIGRKDRAGVGRFYFHGKQCRANRVAYELFCGPPGKFEVIL